MPVNANIMLMATLIFILLSTSVVIVLIYAVIFGQLYLQRKKHIYLYFTIFTAIAIFWSIGDMLMLFSRELSLIHLGYWLFLVAPMLSTLFLLFFSQKFIVGKLKLIYILPVIFIICYAAILYFYNQLIRVDISKVGLNVIHPNIIFYVFYGLYFIAYFNISVKVLYFHPRNDQQKYFQTQNLIYGTGLTGAPGIVTNILLPAIGITQTVWLGPIFSLFFLTFSTIAITKYKLFDIRSAIIRSTGYLFSLAILLILYSLSLIFILDKTALYGARISILGWVGLILMALLASIFFNPLRQYFNKISNRFFYQDAYNPQIFIDNLNQAIVKDIQLESLLKNCSKIIVENIKVDFCVFALKATKTINQTIIGSDEKNFKYNDVEEVRKITPHLHQKVIFVDELSDEDEEEKEIKKILNNYGIGVLARIVSDPNKDIEGIGYILLGYKKSGNPYNNLDKKSMEIVANEMLIAIQNAMQFEEIKKFNITLQQRIEDATRKLRRTNEKLRDLDESKDDFISMASHQLRTPLTSVKGYISMMLEGDGGKINNTQKTMLNQAFFSAQRMVYLIADLLNVSRLKSGKFVIEPKVVDLSNLVSEEMGQMMEIASSKNQTLTYNKPKNFPKLNLDETKTRQVVMNYIDNALYYTPQGGKIDIVLEDKPETVELRVVDNGIGVPKAEQHHLFTKFYRAENARKVRPDGTGLGLFMAKKVIAAEGGAIIFESQEGKGSTFGFTFSKNSLEVKTDSNLKPKK